MIIINNSLFERIDNSVQIVGNVPLSNPFKINDQNCITGSLLRTKNDVAEAFRSWFQYKISSNNPVTIQALDEIAWRVLDGEPVTLNCTCGDDSCHGFIIRDIIMEKINAHRRNQISNKLER